MSEVVKHKLENFEAQPPDRVWEAIAAQLEQDFPQLRERLTAFSAEPPANAWKHISDRLDQPAPVHRIQKNRTAVFKYSMMAAAVILAVIVISVVRNYRKTDDIALDGTSKPATTAATKNDSGNKEIPVIPDSVKGGIPDNQVAAVPFRPEKNARYLTVAHDDGTKVRLSKKVYPVINCAQQTSSSAWSKCKESIQALQTKMATSVNASTDFGSLMDMLKDLEENK